LTILKSKYSVLSDRLSTQFSLSTVSPGGLLAMTNDTSTATPVAGTGVGALVLEAGVSVVGLAVEVEVAAPVVVLDALVGVMLGASVVVDESLDTFSA
jgi:hypothetical protein